MERELAGVRAVLLENEQYIIVGLTQALVEEGVNRGQIFITAVPNGFIKHLEDHSSLYNQAGKGVDVVALFDLQVAGVGTGITAATYTRDHFPGIIRIMLTGNLPTAIRLAGGSLEKLKEIVPHIIEKGQDFDEIFAEIKQIIAAERMKR